MCVEDIACNISVVFLRHSVDDVSLPCSVIRLTVTSLLRFYRAFELCGALSNKCNIVDLKFLALVASVTGNIFTNNEFYTLGF